MKQCYLLKLPGHPVLFTFLLSLFTFISQAQPGSPDPSFGTNGVRIFPAEPTIQGAIVKTLVSISGETYVVYQYSLPGFPFPDPRKRVLIVKYLVNGSKDYTFGSAGFSASVLMTFADAALKADGSIALAGSTAGTNYPDIHDDMVMASFTPAGSLNTNFSSDGITTFTYTPLSYDFSQRVVFDGDRIVVGGYSASLPAGFSFFHVNVYEADGSLSLLFDAGDTRLTNLFAPFDFCQSITANGSDIIIAGYILNTGTGTRDFIAYKFQDGFPDPAFSGDGKLVVDLGGDDLAYTALLNNGKLLLAGSSTAGSSAARFALARFNADGSPDLTFNATGFQFISFPATSASRAIVVRNTDVVVGGTESGNSIGLSMLTDAGMLNPGFGTDGLQTTNTAGNIQPAVQLALAPDRLYAAAVAQNNLQVNYAVVAAYLLTGSPQLALVCPTDVIKNTDPNICASTVNVLDPTVTPASPAASVRWAKSGATSGSGAGSVSGTLFNKGITTVQYQIDATTATCSFNVTVNDLRVPTISGVSASPGYLWPPNHKMEKVVISYNATDNCAVSSSILSVTSDDPAGSSSNDWQVVDAHQVKLRSEKNSGGNDRIYNITIGVKDAAGNQAVEHVYVSVSHGPNFKLVSTGNFTVSAFPNPSSAFFTITSKSGPMNYFSLAVYDAAGRLLERRNELAVGTAITLGRNYQPGLYTLELMNGNEKQVLRLMKSSN